MLEIGREMVYGEASDALLAEATGQPGRRHAVFVRAERVEKDEPVAAKLAFGTGRRGFQDGPADTALEVLDQPRERAPRIVLPALARVEHRESRPRERR